MGGSTPDPTYRNMGDHSEAIRVDFNLSKISYGNLLETFWEVHTPSHPAYSMQYRSAVFYTDDAQKNQALAVKAHLEAERGAALHTALELAGPFYPAENYHQKYNLQHQTSALELLQAHFQGNDSLFSSTTAARLNAFLGGNCQPSGVLQAAKAEGLPPRIIEMLRQALGWNEMVFSER